MSRYSSGVPSASRGASQWARIVPLLVDPGSPWPAAGTPAAWASRSCGGWHRFSRETRSTRTAHAARTLGQNASPSPPPLSSHCRSSSHSTGMRRKKPAVAESSPVSSWLCTGMCTGTTRATYSMHARIRTSSCAAQNSAWTAAGAVSSRWTSS